MKSLIAETVMELRKRGHSISSIADALKISTLRVMEVLRETGVDEGLYAEDDQTRQKTINELLKKK
ncbi:hypothetical protein HZC09_04720 [Candidatus Micrarchaeota archaeon]|nr:hypothetical protein [Candidatus Micrarchaeota archaeon]